MTGAEHIAREQQEQELAELGRELREILQPDAWHGWDEDQRAVAVEAAIDLARQRMGVTQPLPVVWTDDPSERGFEETTGELKLPRSDLAGLAAKDVAGLVGHEVRHVWQWDVIEGQIDPPGGRRERSQFTDAYRVYDADNAFKYQNNELEVDARDRAAYVVEGFCEDLTS